MAIRYAAANGNWSSVATWDGGTTLPTHGDMVYANGKTVVIDQDIDIGNEVTHTAGAFVVGQLYVITSIGSTNFTLIGAASNTVGLPFIATGVGAGTGEAQTRSALTNQVLASPSILTNGGFTLNANYNIRASILGGGTASVLTVGSNSSCTITGLVGFNRSSGAAITVSTTGAFIINGNVYGGTTGAGAAFTTSAASVSLTLNGHIFGGTFSAARAIALGGTSNSFIMTGDIVGGNVSNTVGLYLTGASGSFNITGNATGGPLASTSDAIYVLATPTSAVINGNLTGGLQGSAGLNIAAGSGTYTINGNVNGSSAGSGYGLNQSSTAITTVTGNVTGAASAAGIALTTGTLTVNGTVTGGNGSTGILISASAICNVNGNISGSTFNSNSVGIISNGGTLNIVGTVAGNGVATALQATNSSPTIVNITGNVTGGTAADIYAISFTSNSVSSVLTINGNVTGGSGTNAYAVNGPATGGTINNIVVNGNVIASSTSNAIRSLSTAATSVISINGNISDHISGLKAVNGVRWYFTNTPVNKYHIFSVGGNSTYTWYSQDVWNTEYPPQTDVRFGVLYGAGDTYTGSCYVPGAASVLVGVPVDNTVGSAVTSGGSGPTVGDIADAVRLELAPELALVDAAVSSRLATAGYTAPDTAATVATAVRSELTTELARIDIPVSDATTDISGIPLAVRNELAVELARIDIPVSDATTDISGIPGAVRTELATELARIDAAITTRLSAAGYTAPETKEAIAVAVEAALLNEGDGQQLIDAILQVINTNLDLPALELTAIANAVRSELGVELARIDANVSTAGDPATIAGAVRTELATELARIDAAVTSRLASAGYTAPPAAATVATAVRSELGVELARIDIPVSLSGGAHEQDIADAVRAELTPELDRIANCSTIDSTGAQLAALL